MGCYLLPQKKGTNSLLELLILLEETHYMDVYGDAFLEHTTQIYILKPAIIRFSSFMCLLTEIICVKFFASLMIVRINLELVVLWFLIWQAIEAAIELNLETVEAGAQGEHKIQRGYMPVATYSCHYILDEGFRKSISDFLKREQAQVISSRTFPFPFSICLCLCLQQMHALTC